MMARVLVAALVAMIISILVGPTFIDFLRRNEFGQHIREEGPQHHAVKQGTPTMGGLLIVAAATIAFLAVSRVHAAGADGLRHDARLRRDRLPRRLHQAAPSALARAARALEDAAARSAITAAVGFAAHHQHLATTVFIPIVDTRLPLGPVWYVLLFLVIAGAANGVNLTDGARRARGGHGDHRAARRSPRWR